MPTIVAKLGGLELYSWVFSIYMLTSALTTPIFGKLADLYSQRRLMLIGIAIFLLGSTLCGLAPSMEAMIALSRRFKDSAAALSMRCRLSSSAFSIPADAARENAGHHQRHLGHGLDPRSARRRHHCRIRSWRWIFFVNLPIIAVATALIVVGLKEDRRRAPRAQARHRRHSDSARWR